MKDTKEAIVYGRHPVVDLIKAGKPVDKLLFQQGIRGEFEKEIRNLCKVHDIPFKVVPKDRLSRITGGNHQGIIALVSPIKYYKLADVLPMIYENQKHLFFYCWIM